MIDFRYHLISVIAVLLALGLGILMGASVLDRSFVDHLKAQAERFDERNDDLQEQVDGLEARADAARSFAVQSAPWLLEDALAGRTVVLVAFEGTDGGMLSDIVDEIELGDGTVPTTVTLTEKFELDGTPERDQLALLIRSSSATAVDLRNDAGEALGARMATAAQEVGSSRSRPARRLGSLLRRLEDAGFVSIEAQTGEIVPTGALFLVVGGSADERPFDVPGLTLSLVDSIARRGPVAFVAEPLVSEWGLVRAIRDDGVAAGSVSTVDQAETVEGRIAIVLGLRRQLEGAVDHYGVTGDATRVIPEPLTQN